MQRHAYLIMAYSEYEQLSMLLEMLDYEGNDIYLHIDKKSPLPDKDLLCKNVKYSKVHIYHEYLVYWGDFSQTACELFLLEEAVKSYHDYYHLLSGTDLPLRSQREIHEFFEMNYGKEFVRFWGESFPEKNYERIKLYHPLQKFLRSSKFSAVNAIWEKATIAVNKIQSLVGINRIRNEAISFQKGATWFSITHGFAQEVVGRKEWIYKVFQNTRSSDEIFLHTILNNSSYLKNRAEQTYEKDGLTGVRYIDWKRGKPYIFRKEDYKELMDCGFLFARKFSMSVDKEIIELIYNHIKSIGSHDDKNLPELFQNKENCCGCSACYAVCPVKAIEMKPDREGFLYPQVDADKCICCHKCLSVCAFKDAQKDKGYL